MPMPSRLTEFGCGHDLRTGSQVILWIVLIVCMFGLQEINTYYYETKKVKLTESPLTLIILDLVMGIYTSLSGLYGVYQRKRIWLKQFMIYLGCQFIFLAITIWIYFIYIYPTQPPNPKKTRYVILTTIWAAIGLTGFLSYSFAVVYSHYKDLIDHNDDRGFLINDEENRIAFPVTNDTFPNFPANMSDAGSAVTSRTFETTFPANEPNRPRYTNAFCPEPIPEEVRNKKTAEYVVSTTQSDFQNFN